jgi:hypothetical protein
LRPQDQHLCLRLQARRPVHAIGQG